MGRIQIAYLDPDRMPLLVILRELALRHENLEVDLDRIDSAPEYEARFLAGELDVVCEHMRFIFSAVAEGHSVRFFASSQNHLVEAILAKPGIGDLHSLRGRRVAIRGTQSSRLNALLWLDQLGLASAVDVVIVEDREVGRWEQWRTVIGGRADAVICSPLYASPALEAGLHQIDVEPMQALGPLFMASLGRFLENHQEELYHLVRSLYRAIHVFRDDPPLALSILRQVPPAMLGLDDESDLADHYQRLRGNYSERPVPTPAALLGTQRQIMAETPQLGAVNPVGLFDLRFILELEEQHFLERLREDATASR